MNNSPNFISSILLSIISLLFVLPGFCLAQKVDLEKEKKEIRKLDDRWNQIMLEPNLEIIKEFYPDNHVERVYTGFSENKYGYQETYDSFAKQFKTIKYLSVKEREKHDINFSDDGHTAWYYSIFDFEQQNIKTGKKRKFSIGGLAVLIKKGGKWLFHSNTSVYRGETEKSKIAKIILEQYTGKYQTDEGRVFEVTTDGTQLIFKNENGDVHKYFAQSEYVFFQDETDGTLVFGRDKNGKVSHYSSFWNGSFYGTRKKIK